MLIMVCILVQGSAQSRLQTAESGSYKKAKTPGSLDVTPHVSNMKFRQVVIFSGQQYSVPQNIQRIDTRATHGWQVRYAGTKMFSDHTPDGSGATASLQAAISELKKRIAECPNPSKLQPKPNATKTSNLPVGISGPIVRQRAGSAVRTAELCLLLPQYGKRPRHTTVYIGNEHTYTPERYLEAVEKAVAKRKEAEAIYREEETKARLAAGRALKVKQKPIA
jgi:hypothetical protein